MRNILGHTENKDLLKKKPVIAQETKTKTSYIIFKQKWILHTIVYKATNKGIQEKYWNI